MSTISQLMAWYTGKNDKERLLTSKADLSQNQIQNIKRIIENKSSTASHPATLPYSLPYQDSLSVHHFSELGQERNVGLTVLSYAS